MADHGEVQYATAEGNDLPAHEEGYTEFVQAVFIATATIISILFGLTIGGVLGHWLPAAFVLVAAVITGCVSAWTGSRAVCVAMAAVAALMLLFNAYT
jgi:putative Mn2+ efflux pump MntP